MKNNLVINTNRIPFLNTFVDNLTAKEAKACIDQLLQTPGYHYVVTPNTDIVMKMQNDPDLKRICEEADLILTDGQVVVNISGKTGFPIKERVAMTDFVWEVMDLADEKGYKIFLFGGEPDKLEKAEKRLKQKYRNLQIAGSYSPPFGFETNEQQLQEADERIRKSGADILIVFLGCPKQEKFIAENRDKYQIPLSITMGGCVDFISDSVRRAPLWMQKAGFEWFYRFLQEPGRLFRRYFIDDMKIFALAWKYRRKK